MSLSWLPPVLLFSLLLLTIVLYGLTVVVHFPIQARSPRMRTWPGRIVLWISIPVVALAAVHAIGFAAARLPAPAAIIGTGAALLAAPLILQRFPDSFANGRRGLIVLAGLAGALAFAAHRLGG